MTHTVEEIILEIERRIHENQYFIKNCHRYEDWQIACYENETVLLYSLLDWIKKDDDEPKL